jgi:hypothetical protein
MEQKRKPSVIRRPLQPKPPRVATYTTVHCGCGFKAETVLAPRIAFDQLADHCEETGHCGHFQGEVRPLLQRAVTQ